MKRILAKGTTAEQRMASAVQMVKDLTPDRAWCIEVLEWRRPRTNQQNAYLWGVVYPAILEASAMLDGWTRDDLHEYFLGECFGWETLEGFGRKRLRPLKRSSRMNKQEFTDYLDFISRRCAELHIIIPEPSYETD